MVVVSKFLEKYGFIILGIMFLFGTTLLAFLGISKKEPSEKVLEEVDEEESRITDIDARVIADALWQEFDGLFGSNGDKINMLLKGLSLPDFKRVSKQFGNPYRDDNLGTEGGWLLGNKKRDLIYWLGSELSIDEKQSLRDLNPNIPI